MALQVWLPLNGTLENKGLSNVTVTNNGATVDNNGKIGKCYLADGSHYISVSSQPWMSMKSNYKFSLFIWVKGTTSWLIAASGWELILRDSYACIGISGSQRYPARHNATYSSTTWYHLGFTWDGSTGKLRLYINGEEKAVSDVPSSANFNVDGSLKLTYAGPVYINDFRIYDHCLSPKEVKEISKGLILHYKLDGNDIGITIPRNGDLIPDGVELYDYILSSGGAYLTTNYAPTINMKVKTKIVAGSNTSLNAISGYTWTASSSFLMVYSNTIRWHMNSGAGLTSTVDVRNGVTVEIEASSNRLVVNGVVTTGTALSSYNQTNYYLFYTPYNNNSSYEYFGGKMYYYQIYDNGTLVRNFIPCTYLGEPGMWDTVENKFYRNQGTGLFTLGNKITLKEYEYLKGNGSGYLDTNVIATANTKLRFAFKETLNSSTTYYPLCHVSGTGLEFFTRANTNYAVWAGGEKLVNGPNTTNLVDIELTHNYCKTNGTVLVSDYGTHLLTLPNVTIPIFGYRKDDNSLDSRKGSHMLHYFQIYEDNQLIRDFIPVSYNGTPGLWDKVEWKFYANAGSGSFTLGPEKTVQQDAPIFYDSSGYCNHGSITGTLTTSNDSSRYEHSTKFPDSTCAIGIGNLQALIPEGVFTFNIWFKKVTGEWSSKPWETILGGPSRFELETKRSTSSAPVIVIYNWGGLSDSSKDISYSLDAWNMLTMVRTTSNTKFYLNGELKVTGTIGSVLSGDYFIGAWQTTTQQNYRGFLSDARIYATALSEDDVKELYNTSAFVTNSGVFAEYELYEDNLSDVKKTGLLETANFYENGAESGYALDTDKTRVASNYIISEEFIEI